MGQQASSDTSTLVPITDLHLRALPQDAAGRSYLRDAVQRGLMARVLPRSGIVQFSVRYRFHGHHRRLKLGDYPDVTLQEARKRARNALARVDDGGDPASEQRAKKAERSDTVEALVDEYLAKHARTHKSETSAAADKRMLHVDVLPKWRDRSVRDLTRRDVRSLIDSVAERAPVAANRVLALVRKMLNFAIDHDWIDANPAARVQKPTREISRDRVLTDDELRRLWRVLTHHPITSEKPAPGRNRATGAADDPLCPISPALAAVLQLRLLTAQRGGEVARMRWSDVALDTGWWTIPGSDTKNREPHRVYLVEEARALIRVQDPGGEERQEYVFVGRGGASVLARAKKAPGEIGRVLGIDFRGHDLRRTAATRIAEAGIPRDHISRVLNYVEGGPRATKVYDRYDHDREKQIALETWARRLRAILGQQNDAATVLPFDKRA